MKWFKEKRIVVPFDFSADSVEAIEVALTMAPRQEDIYVLHVIPELPANDPYVIWDDDCDRKRKEHARIQVKNRLADLNASGINVDIGIGKAGATIAKLANQIDAGLIIIPSHNERGIKRLLIGSTAERVVRLAKCPVLVLKEDAA
ncbi:MAG: universal stress protein [Pirellulaceae bacterium]